MSLEAENVRATSIMDLNAECFRHLIQFLTHREITALSYATCLWLKDLPLKYEDMTDFKLIDMENFLERYGVHIKSLIITEKSAGDIKLYLLHATIAEYCPNIERLDVQYSEDNKHLDFCMSMINKLTSVRTLELRGTFWYTQKAALLSEFKCVPRLNMITMNASTMDWRCIEQCRKLKMHPMSACTIVKPEVPTSIDINDTTNPLGLSFSIVMSNTLHAGVFDMGSFNGFTRNDMYICNDPPAQPCYHLPYMQ